MATDPADAAMTEEDLTRAHGRRRVVATTTEATSFCEAEEE